MLPALLPALRGLTVFFIATICLAGCSTTSCCLTFASESADASHYLILGFGRVTIPKTAQHHDIMASRLQSFGVAISDLPGFSFGLGYSSSSVITVPAVNPGTLVEVSTCPASAGIRLTALTPDPTQKEDP